jgi:hypothetical protein
MAAPLASAFEALARAFLEDHESLRHEWREGDSRWWGDRLDLVFQPPSPEIPEVYASLLAAQIAVGAGEQHEDFESFGRRLTDEQVARLAFERLVELLMEHGYITG